MARLPADAEGFIRANTALERPAMVPEFRLWLATEYVPIWQATEAWLEQQNVDPPYWAFCWPGGQAIARYVLDNPGEVRGKRVIDFAAEQARIFESPRPAEELQRRSAGDKAHHD